MQKNAVAENSVLTPEHGQAILPLMTALFVDGLGPVQSGPFTRAEWFGPNPALQQKARIFRLPIDADGHLPVVDRTSLKRSIEGSKETQDRNTIEQLYGRGTGVRPLIQGISHHFNNLLMGIWGNVTLIRLQLENNHPLYPCAIEMERLIQSGAYMIHLVLGYLGERRTAAKRLRLNQLIAQIHSELPEEKQLEAHWDFEARLKWAARVQRPRLIACSTARVLELLFNSIQAHAKVMHASPEAGACIRKKIDTIDALVQRGLDLTHRLRLYAGDIRMRMTRIDLNIFIRRMTAQFTGPAPRVRVSSWISPQLPAVRADRTCLKWVLKEIVDNAANAMPDGGKLDITVRTLQEQAPQERCGVLKGSDYIVITFKDSGCGLSLKHQKRIFEPFFTHPRKHGHAGLGLSAAAGVLMAHNGYIQVRSTEKAGSIITVYLPIAGAAVQEQQIKEAY
ncbi:MAG: ATP-binding protein [Desulfobacteraceae bacterium]|nr:ATP-binding protein [Desulfobacteraceae bacterium]